MPDKRMTISLEDYIKHLLKKWKLYVVVVAGVTACFAVGSIMLGNEISVPHSEEYLHYEQILEWHESYLEESILMNLDSLSIHQRTLYLENISNPVLLKDYSLSSEIWEDYETEKSKKYISELIEWEENGENAEITLRHATEEECTLTAAYLEEKLLEKDENLKVIIGAEKVVTDEKLQEEQLRWYSRIDYVNSLLLDSQAGYTIRVSIPAAVLTGVFMGSLICMFAGLISFVVKKER